MSSVNELDADERRRQAQLVDERDVVVVSGREIEIADPARARRRCGLDRPQGARGECRETFVAFIAGALERGARRVLVAQREQREAPVVLCDCGEGRKPLPQASERCRRRRVVAQAVLANSEVVVEGRTIDAGRERGFEQAQRLLVIAGLERGGRSREFAGLLRGGRLCWGRNQQQEAEKRRRRSPTVYTRTTI